MDLLVLQIYLFIQILLFIESYNTIYRCFKFHYDYRKGLTDNNK